LLIEQVMMRIIKIRGGLIGVSGMNKYPFLMWIHTKHMSASTYEAMPCVTKLTHITRDQHVEIGASRCDRDFKQIRKINLT
jgi:hypothetical protein